MPYKRPTYKNLTDDQLATLDTYLSEHGQGNADLTDLLHIAIGRSLAKKDNFPKDLSTDKIRHIADWLKAAIRNDEPWLKHKDPQGRHRDGRQGDAPNRPFLAIQFQSLCLR